MKEIATKLAKSQAVNDPLDLSTFRVKDININKSEDIASTSKVIMYTDLSYLNALGLNRILDLHNKYIIYGIVLENGKWYFGRTDEFRERAYCHLKDITVEKRKNKKLYEDLAKFKRAFMVPLKICDNLNESKEKEKEIIDSFKKEILKEKLGEKRFFTVSLEELREESLKYCYNILS